MPNFICTTCGTQYAESEQPPAACAICEEPRQYIKKTGQQWTTLERLRLTHRNSIKFKEPGLVGVGIEWAFAPNWSAKVEYNFLGLEHRTFITPFGFQRLAGDTFFVRNRDIQMVKVGINYRFNLSGYGHGYGYGY